jgi:hypothetical protein
MKQVKGIYVDSVHVTLVNGDTGQYRISWRDCDNGRSRFIAHCYGFENSVRVANGLAENQVEYVQSPPCKSALDLSEYS